MFSHPDLGLCICMNQYCLQYPKFFLKRPLGCHCKPSQLSAFCTHCCWGEHVRRKCTCFGRAPQSLAPDLPRSIPLFVGERDHMKSYVLPCWSFFFFFFQVLNHRKAQRLTKQIPRHPPPPIWQMPIFSVYRVFKKIWNEQNITIQVQCFQPHGRALPPCLSWMGHRDHGHHICVSVNNLWCRCRGVFKVPQLAFCHSTLHFWWLCMVI